MELMYPWVIFIGIPVLIFLIFFKFKRNEKYKNGTKIANTQYAKKMPYYQKILLKYKRLVFATKIICIICIFISLVLLARPIKIEKVENKLHSRDIYICIDASTSVNNVTKELVHNFQNLLDGLDGERVGITIFNTTSVVLVPLTDDYDYVKDILDEIDKAIAEQEKQENGENYSFYYYNYMFEGTIIGNDKRGSSLIGDGLASTIYKFPEIDEERTRIIILATDNVDSSLPGGAVMTLKEATKLAKEKNVNLFAIAPGEGEVENDWITQEEFAKGSADLKQNIEAVGGTYYENTSTSKMKDIVSKINKTSKSLIDINKERREIGKPEIPFIMLIVAIALLFIINKKVKI